MSIDFDSERVISLQSAAAFVGVHRSTVYRWADGSVDGCCLETLRVGGRRRTSVEALQRFFERLTASGASPGPEPSQAATAAERELGRRGF